MASWRSGALLVGAALAAGCGSGNIVTSPYSATLHFDQGRQTSSFRLHEPDGVILLYRISAPRGAKVRGSVQLPRITVPLLIATRPTGPSSGCTELRSRVSCTVGEEWCPMPEGTWHVRVEKLGGPAGDVVVSFRVGKPSERV